MHSEYHGIDSGPEGPCLYPRTKKPAHSSDKSPERLALNSPVHIPLPGTACVPSFASDHARSLLNDGGGLLRGEQYHTRKICQAAYFGSGLN
jgi:hypothetical protein